APSPTSGLGRLLRHRRGVLGGLAVMAMVVTGSLAPTLAPYSYSTQSLLQRLQPPSAAHWLGTDGFGRDVLSRTIWGSRVSPVIVVQTSWLLGQTIVIESGLSYLGLGAQPPLPSWGNMVVDGRQFLASAWWIATFPGLAIFVTVLGFNLFGDGLRDAFDPALYSESS